MFKIDENYTDYYKTDPVKYPGGGAINSSGIDTTDGTPWLAKMFDNCVGWMQALYIKAFGSLTGISGEAENAQTSDVVRALDKIRGDNNAAERTISENTYFKKAGGVISGDTSVEGQLHVKGDLIVDGTGEEIISTELKVGANTITLRNGNPSALGNTELAGVVTENYDGNNHNNIIAVRKNGEVRTGDIDIATRFLYSNDGTNFYTDEDLTILATIGTDEEVRDTGNQTSGGVKIYEGITYSNDDTQPLLTRAESNALANGHIPVWDATNKRVVDSGRGITDSVTYNDPNLVSSGAVWNKIVAMFPVGTVYQNKLDGTNPGTLFGFGTWIPITDKFLACRGDSLRPGGIIGNFSYQLTEANIPLHNHGGSTGSHDANVSVRSNVTGINQTNSLTADQVGVSINDGGHSHGSLQAVGGEPYLGYPLAGGAGFFWQNVGGSTDPAYSNISATHDHIHSITDNGHTHDIVDGGHLHSISSYGQANPTAIVTVPEYVDVYTWYRES